MKHPDAWVSKRAIGHIVLGGNGIKTVDDFYKKMNAKGIRMGMWGDALLRSSSFAVFSQETKMLLVMISDHDLEFHSGCSPLEAIARAQEYGFQLCPFETGPQTALQLPPSSGSSVVVATNPISIGVGHDPHLMLIENNKEGIWFKGTFFPLNLRIPPVSRFLFVAPA